MEEPIRLRSLVKPEKLVCVEENSWVYNYNIVELPAISGDGETTAYEFSQIYMDGQPDYKKCVEAVIRSHITQSQEFDLINSYNSAMFNLLSEEETSNAGADYVQYLQKVAEIKELVKKDFE